MKTYIALLKGINVGGHKKVPMAELRELLKNAKFQNVQTYIQSGNVIFQSSERPSQLENKIQKLIVTQFGFEVSVIVKTNKELQIIFEACPFSKEKKENSYFIILNKIPETSLLKEVDKIPYENEEVVIKNDCLYFYCSTGYGKTKFNMNTYERKLKVIGTARNYNTMLKLLSLSTEAN
ncbi:DUF1697 domain-containing protein [Confluentibacter sediminis]|uniref:DUF1697 domain-containing protein n=1 Tax=Confluentibacter sediminis TaxID=2219045 RepID=UPI000DAF2C1E|nr:DUF1697 domain-containing protein [Confluentibacter sediminis]